MGIWSRLPNFSCYDLFNFGCNSFFSHNEFLLYMLAIHFFFFFSKLFLNFAFAFVFYKLNFYWMKKGAKENHKISQVDLVNVKQLSKKWRDEWVSQSRRQGPKRSSKENVFQLFPPKNAKGVAHDWCFLL